MSLPQHILFEIGNTVTLHVPVRPAAAQTVSCYTGLGAAVFETKTATLEAINTTLNGAITRGATTLVVTAATNIAAKSILWLNVFEQVVVESVASTTVTLRRPVLNDHANGVAIASNKLTYAVSGGVGHPAVLGWAPRVAGGHWAGRRKAVSPAVHLH